MSALLNMAVLASLGGSSSGAVAAPTLTGSPTLVASWDFNNSGTVSLSGSNITSISGSDGTSFTLTSGASNPTQVSRGGKNTARFTAASSQFMQVASALGITGECTLVLVYESNVADTTQFLLDIGNGASASTANRRSLMGVATTGLGARRADTTQQDALVGSAYAAAKFLQIGRFPTGTERAYLNVNGVGTAVQSSGTNAAPTGLSHTTLGARRVSGAESSFADIWVWRVLVYSTSISDTAAEEIAVWAASNYSTTNAA